MSDENLPVPLGKLVAKATFYVSKWLDPDQVRVSELSPTEFRVKCGKMLSDQEVKGAIVKYLLSKQLRIQPMSARDELPFDQMHEDEDALTVGGRLEHERLLEARDDDEGSDSDLEEVDDLDDDEDGADEIFGFGDGEDEDMEDEEDLDQDYTEDLEDEPSPEDEADAEDLEGLDD